MKRTPSEQLRENAHIIRAVGRVGFPAVANKCDEAADALDLAEKALEEALDSVRFTDSWLDIRTSTKDKIHTALKAIKGVE